MPAIATEMFFFVLLQLASRFCSFTPVEIAPGTNRRLGELIWALWRRKKNLISDGNRNLVLQCVARRYTNWTIATPKSMLALFIFPMYAYSALRCALLFGYAVTSGAR
jgi:hypothetical protein